MTHLSSNGVPVPFTPDLFTRLPDSTGLLHGDPGALRRRLLAEGCVVLRGVLGRATVLRLRGDYFAGPARAYLAPGSDPVEGAMAGRLPPDVPEYGHPEHPAYRFVDSGGLRALFDQPELWAIARELLGGEVELMPRRVLAHRHRGERRGSGAHIDLDSMARGSERALTLWIPLGDCPPDGGGLVYLENSHTLRPAEYALLRAPKPDTRARAPGADGPPARAASPSADAVRRRAPPLAHDLELTARRFGRRWRWREYHAGDVVAHLPRAVHAALDTRTDRMRLSVDARYVRAGDAVDERWRAPWSAGDAAGL